MFDIKTKLDGDSLTVSPIGLLDSRSAPDLKDILDWKAAKVNELIFDFAGLDYLTSAGLRVLLAALQNMNSRKGSVRIINMSDEITELMRMTGFLDILEDLQNN